MHELEFLPQWYASLHQRRRTVVVQAWAILMLIVGLGFWMFLAEGNIEKKTAQHQTISRQLTETRAALRHLDEQTALRAQLEQQHQILRKLGLHVEAARVLSALDRVMPREMTLLEVHIDTREINRPLPPAAGGKNAPKPEPAVDRQLTVSLTAVAPTNVDVANFLAELSNVPFFDDVAPKAIEPKTEAGHEMRKFDVTFTMNLNDAGA